MSFTHMSFWKVILESLQFLPYWSIRITFIKNTLVSVITQSDPIVCQLSHWMSKSKWIWKPCNSTHLHYIKMFEEIAKWKAIMTCYGHIWASICITNLVCPTFFFARDKKCRTCFLNNLILPNTSCRLWKFKTTSYMPTFHIVHRSWKIKTSMSLIMLEHPLFIYITMCSLHGGLVCVCK